MNLHKRQCFSQWFLVLVVLALSACSSGQMAPTPSAGIDGPTPACQSRPLPSGVTADHIPGQALPTVVAASTVILIGQAQPSTEIVNLARGNSFAIGQVYTVTVQRYLKGSGPSPLKVIQPEGELNQPAACVTEPDMAQAKALWANEFIPLRASTDYLLLLTRLPRPSLTTDYFIGTDRRWRWRLQSDGTGVLEVIGYTFPAWKSA